MSDYCEITLNRLLKFVRIAAAVLWSSTVVVGGAHGDQSVSTLRPGVVAGEIETVVEVHESIRQMLSRGDVPNSLEQLIAMENQQQRVASRVGQCTVNVAIGAAQGCGVIVTGDGYILTAAHVAMRPGKRATVTFQDGRTVAATTLGMNREVDAGLIRINDGQSSGIPWPHATLGRSESLRPGMWCIASGHPGGFERDRGPVTRVGRILKVRPNSIVTDCALIGGDSGGPLFDFAGRLIAVHSRIGNDVADNLHVPIDHYDKHWDALASGQAWGYLEGFKPMIGLRGSPSSATAIIDLVYEGSPADVAGFVRGDIVERFGEMTITDFKSLTTAVADTMPGERVICRVNRNGDQHRLVVEIGRADE